jgi:hypothetical protein
LGDDLGHHDGIDIVVVGETPRGPEQRVSTPRRSVPVFSGKAKIERTPAATAFALKTGHRYMLG